VLERGAIGYNHQSQKDCLAHGSPYGASGLNVCFWFGLAWPHSSPVPSFWNRNVRLCLFYHYTLDICNFLLYLSQGLTDEFALSVRGDFGLGFLSNVAIVKTLETLEDGLKTFFILKWT
jgi:hypothetical protein